MAVTPSDFPVTLLGEKLLDFISCDLRPPTLDENGAVTNWRGVKDLVNLVPIGAQNTRPGFTADEFNGFPAVIFDGVATALKQAPAPFLTGAAEGEMWLVCTQEAQPYNSDSLEGDNYSRQAVAIGNTTDNNARQISRQVPNSINAAYGRTGLGSGSVSASPGGAVDFSFRHVIRYQVKATQAMVSVDGGPKFLSSVYAAPGTSGARLRVGCTSRDDPGDYWLGMIPDVLFSQLLDDTMAAQLMAHFMQKTAFNATGSMVIGALRDSSISACAELANPTAGARLTVSRHEDLSAPDFVGPVVASVATAGGTTTYNTVKGTAPPGSLTPGTTYFADFVVPGQVGGAPRRFRTPPREGLAGSFGFQAFSCSRTLGNNNTRILRAGLRDDPLFAIHMGDLDYSNIPDANIPRYRDRNWRQFMKSKDAQAYVARVPMAWMPDNHDRTYQNAQWTYAFESGITYDQSVTASGRVYNETFPHYPYAFPGAEQDNSVLSQQWKIGRCAFIMPDMRAQRHAGYKTLLGETYGYERYNNRAWLLQAMLDAQSGGAAMIFFIVTPAWYGNNGETLGKDNTEEQNLILAHIKTKISIPVWVLSGDIHKSAIDDGTYGTIPTVFCSPLHKGHGFDPFPCSFRGEYTGVTDQLELFTHFNVKDDGGPVSGNPITLEINVRGGVIDPVTFEPTTYRSITTPARLSVGGQSSYLVTEPENGSSAWLAEINPPQPSLRKVIPLPEMPASRDLMAPDKTVAPVTVATVYRFADRPWTGEPGDALMPNVPYLARLAEPPQITRDVPIYPDSPRRAALDAGSLSLYNGDGALAQLESDWSLAGCKVVLLRIPHHRPRHAAYATARRVAEMRLSNAFQGTARLTVPLRSVVDDLTAPLCRTFGGTGGMDGTADLAGQNRPLVCGYARQVSPVLIDPANLVYMLSDGPVLVILALRDRGVPLTPDGDVPTYAALVAATITPGTYKTCVAAGLFRVGVLTAGQPPRQLTADLRGDTSSGGYGGGTPAHIVMQLLRGRGGIGAERSAEGSFSGFPSVEVGAVFRDGTVADAIDRITASVIGWWGGDLFGNFVGGCISPPEATSPVLVLSEMNLLAPPEETEQPRAPWYRATASYQVLDTVQTGDNLLGAVSDADRAYYGQANRIAFAPVDGSGNALRGRFNAAVEGPMIPGLFAEEVGARGTALRAMALYGTDRRSWLVRVPSTVWPFLVPGMCVRLVWAGLRNLGAGRNMLVRQIVTQGERAEILLWG
jgi:hypothetical protein